MSLCGKIKLTKRLPVFHRRYAHFFLKYFIERLRMFKTQLVGNLCNRKTGGAKQFGSLIYKFCMDVLLCILAGMCP